MRAIYRRVTSHTWMARAAFHHVPPVPFSVSRWISVLFFNPCLFFLFASGFAAVVFNPLDLRSCSPLRCAYSVSPVVGGFCFCVVACLCMRVCVWCSRWSVCVRARLVVRYANALFPPAVSDGHAYHVSRSRTLIPSPSPFFPTFRRHPSCSGHACVHMRGCLTLVVYLPCELLGGAGQRRERGPFGLVRLFLCVSVQHACCLLHCPIGGA